MVEPNSVHPIKSTRVPPSGRPGAERTGERSFFAQRSVVWVAAAHAALALLLFDPSPFIGGDNFWYMLLAEGLRSGEGYRDLWLPGTPPHTHFPPFYPVVLAGVGLVANSVIAFKLVSLLCTTAAVALTFGLVRRRTGDLALSIGAGLLVGSAAVVVEYAHWALSEGVFLLLVTASLYAFVRDPGGRDSRWFALGTGAALLAYLTRSAGLPLLLAVVIALSARRRWGRLAVFVGLALVVGVGWWLRVRWAAADGAPLTTYGQEFLYRDPYRPELGTVTIGDLLARIAHNLRLYVLAAWPRALGGRSLGPGLAGVVGLVLGVAVLLGGLRRVRRLEAPELFFFLYAGVILLWPESWGDQRFLLPLMPLASLYLIDALEWGFPGAGRPWSLGVRPALAAVGLIIAFTVLGDLRPLGPRLACSREAWRGNVTACYPSAYADFLGAARWIGARTERDAVVINRKPQILYWYARRRGDRYPFTEDADSLIRVLDSRGARYVVVDNLGGTSYRYLVPVIQKHSDRFRLLYRQGNPPTYVLEYVSGARP